MPTWTKDKPIPPKTRPSQFYWYYEESIDEEYPVELWPGRYIGHHNGLWWPVPIERAPSRPIKAKKKKRGKK